MSPLRQRLIEELSRRRYSPRTIQTYVECVSLFARYFKSSPDFLGPNHIRQYQLHLIDRGLSRSRLIQAVCALRFFFRFVLDRDWAQNKVATFIPFPRSQRKIPDILSKEDTARLLAAIPSLKYRAALMTAYAGGLRLSEVLHLKISDVDSQRMLLFVRQGKGAQDRYVMLGHKLLALLREYWTAYRPSSLLFPGRAPDIPLSPHTLQNVCRRAALAAVGPGRHITPHALRHGFASHLSENGVALTDIQDLLGHRYITTTARYVHLSPERLRSIKSPADFLDPVVH